MTFVVIFSINFGKYDLIRFLTIILLRKRASHPVIVVRSYIYSVLWCNCKCFVPYCILYHLLLFIF